MAQVTDVASNADHCLVSAAVLAVRILHTICGNKMLVHVLYSSSSLIKYLTRMRVYSEICDTGA